MRITTASLSARQCFYLEKLPEDTKAVSSNSAFISRHDQRDTCSHVERVAINIFVAHANKSHAQTFDFALARFVIRLRRFARVRFAVNFDGQMK